MVCKAFGDYTLHAKIGGLVPGDQLTAWNLGRNTFHQNTGVFSLIQSSSKEYAARCTGLRYAIAMVRVVKLLRGVRSQNYNSCQPRIDQKRRGGTAENGRAQIPSLAVSILEVIRSGMMVMGRAWSAERSTRGLVNAYRNKRMVVFGNTEHSHPSLDRSVQVARRNGKVLRRIDKIRMLGASQVCSFGYTALGRLHVC
jgi:hypothetical protein